MQKNQILLFIISIFLSGCLQEGSYIENFPMNNEPRANNFNQNKEKTIFEDENYYENNKKKPIDEITLNTNTQNDEIVWDNIFNEDPEKKTENNKNEELDLNKIKKNNDNQKNLKNQKIENTKLEKKPNNINEKQAIKKYENKKTETKKQVNTNSQINKKNLSKPVNGQIISKFGKFSKNNDSNDGISFKAKSENIFSCADGRIIYIDNHGETGKTIIIKFDNGIVGSYVFNGNILVNKDDIVKNRQNIGKINNLENGNNIVYFTTRENGKMINPEEYFLN